MRKEQLFDSFIMFEWKLKLIMKNLVLFSLLTIEASNDCSNPETNGDFLECQVNTGSRYNFNDFYWKDYFSDIYVSCVQQCPDSLCSSECARAFNENLKKEKVTKVFSVCDE